MPNQNKTAVDYNPHAPGPRNGLHWLIIALSVLTMLYCYFQLREQNREIVTILQKKEVSKLSELKIPHKYAFVMSELERAKGPSNETATGPLASPDMSVYLALYTVILNHNAMAFAGDLGIAASILLLLCTLFYASRTPSKIILNNEGLRLDTSSKMTFWKEIAEVSYVNQAAIPGGGEIVIRAGEKKSLRIRLAGVSKEQTGILISALKNSPARLELTPELLAIEGHEAKSA